MNEDDVSEPRFIRPITAYPCEGDLSHLCEEYGCARKGGLSPHSKENLTAKRMTYAANHKNLASYVSCNPRKRSAIEKGGGILRRIFDRILDAMHESRRRQAEIEIANFVARQGGRITADLEREMARRLLTLNWSPRE